MPNPETLRLLYLLREKRLELDRQSREIADIEKKLAQPWIDYLRDGNDSPQGKFQVELKERISPSWKEQFSRFCGAEKVNEVIAHTEPTYSISVGIKPGCVLPDTDIVDIGKLMGKAIDLVA